MLILSVNEKVRILRSLALATACAVAAAASPANADQSRRDILVDTDEGGPRKVGEIAVTGDANGLRVRYQILNAQPINPADHWCLTGSRLHVAPRADLIPHAESRAVPRLFAHQMRHDCVQSYTYDIPMSESGANVAYLSADAEVTRMGGLDALEALIPHDATVTVVHDQDNPKAYFEGTISNAGILDGKYDAWCVDTRHLISPGVAYRAGVHSSYAELPAGTVDHPDRMPNVNWLLNQRMVGKASPAGLGNYTYGDVQRTVWELLEDKKIELGLGEWKQERVNELVTAAVAGGNGFRPACNQTVGVVIVPNDTAPGAHAQTTIGETTLPRTGVPCAPSSLPGRVPATPFPCTKREACVPDGSGYFTYSVRQSARGYSSTDREM